MLPVSIPFALKGDVLQSGTKITEIWKECASPTSTITLLKMEEERFSETSLYFCQTMWYYVP